MTISVAVLHALVMLGVVCFWWLLMDQNPEQGGKWPGSHFLVGSCLWLELQTEVQSFMSSQPTKFTSKFEGYRGLYGYMQRSLIDQVHFLCRSLPIHCRVFCWKALASTNKCKILLSQMGHSHAKRAFTSESHSQILKLQKVMEHISRCLKSNLVNGAPTWA